MTFEAMASATFTVNPIEQRQNRGLRVLIRLSLLPGTAYFIIMMLALFGVPGPARWLVGILSGIWSVPLLWALVVGGPLLSAIGSLILSTRHPSNCRLDRVFGGAAAVLLLLNLLSWIPFPFLLAMD